MRPVDTKSGLTVERLKQVLAYNPADGAFTWISKTSKNATDLVGKTAGAVDSTGYIRIWIDGKRYVAHRLAWLYMTGDWPSNLVDHRDTIKTNNVWSNLREATNSENKANGKSYKKTSGLPKGVRRNGNKFSGQAVHNYKNHYCGSFDTPEEAHAAYVRVAAKLHGEFSRAA